MYRTAAAKILATPVGRPPIFQYLNLKSADCSISLKVGTEFYHITVDTLQVFEFKRSEVKVTARRDISAVKNYKLGTDRLNNFKLGMSLVIKAETKWRDGGADPSCNAP